MLRWSISNASFSSRTMIFTTSPGLRLERVRMITLAPEILASTSAIGELQHALSSFTTSKLWGESTSGCGNGSGRRGLGLGVGLGLKLFLCFLASSDCRTWCNSLMNSMAPPMIDAWSPFVRSLIYRTC